jgi:hypothetical protein
MVADSPLQKRETEMHNADSLSDIRSLRDAELDEVNGGIGF